MRGMWRHKKKLDVMLHTEGDCFGANMASVAITNEETLLSISLRSGSAFKENEPFITNFITCPSVCTTSEPPTFIRVFWYPR